MGVLAGGSGDRRSAAESVRRLVAGLGCTPAEALALAVLVAGGVAVLGVLWLLARPGDPLPASAPGPPTPASGEHESVAGPELEADDLVVHVAGEVADPGLHELPAGARVADAVQAAGGPTDDALTAGLNLAREVSDGEQLYVPGREEGGSAGGPDPGRPDSPGSPGAFGRPGGGAGGNARGAGGASAWRPDGRLDLNRATTDDLEELDGIGEVLAERIVTHRERQGRFDEVGQLRDVSGIGEKTFQRLAELVVV